MTILYQAYGSKDLYRQVVFSLLTLYYHLQGDFGTYRIVIYTDNPGFFRLYAKYIPISFEAIDKQMLQKFRGQLNFVHRVKICVLADCFAKYKDDLLYLDADTYFTESPEKLLKNIGPNAAIMNSDDYDLLTAAELYEDSNWLRIRKAIRNHTYTLAGRTFKIPMTTRMWNAGVIGMSYQNSDLLHQVIDLTDQIYQNKKVFTAEQFAFSYVLQNNLRLVSSGDVIFHYWPDFSSMPWKQTYNHHFRKFFRQNGGLDVSKQAASAFQLTQQHEQLRLPEKTLLSKVGERLKMAAKIMRRGAYTPY